MGIIHLLCSEGRTTILPQTGHAWDMAYRQRGHGLSWSAKKEPQPTGILPSHPSPMSGTTVKFAASCFLTNHLGIWKPHAAAEGYWGWDTNF